MEVTYSQGPRVLLDGTNLDQDVLADFPRVITVQDIADPVTGLDGLGYMPGQKNKDGGAL